MNNYRAAGLVTGLSRFGMGGKNENKCWLFLAFVETKIIPMSALLDSECKNTAIYKKLFVQ